MSGDLRSRLLQGLERMANECTAPPALWNRFSNDALQAADALTALRDLVGIIDAAGLLNLSNGVQLGPTSWYVKASDRLEHARGFLAERAISQALGQESGE